MKAQSALEIANTQGRFMYFYNNKQYDRIVDELFSSASDACVKFHDEKVNAYGKTAIRAAFEGISKQFGESKVLHMINSPIIQVSERNLSAQATWTTLSFVLKGSREEREAEPVVTRFDLDYVKEKGHWKILHLEWYMFLSLNPWKCPAGDDSDWINRQIQPLLPVPEETGSTRSEDWWAIVKLQNRYTHDRRKDMDRYFSKAEDASFYLPVYLDGPATGYKSICQALNRLDQMEEDNEKLYLSTLLLTNPVVEVDPDGVHARGAWLGMNIGIKGPAFGEEPPYPVEVYFLYLDQKFVKEDGIWKFHTFNAQKLFGAPVWHFDPASTAGLIAHDRRWHYPPVATRAGTPEDYLEIENIQGWWVNTLKSARPSEFVDRLVAVKSEGVEYHTHDPFMEADDSGLRRKANNVVGAKGVENYREQARLIEAIKQQQPHHPSCHTTTTPLIEVDEDGEHATAFWFDFGWTMFAEGFDLPPEEWHANPCFARYAQQYIKDQNGKWKIWKFSWYPLFRFNSMWPFKPEAVRGWAGSETAEPWPMPFERYVNEDL